MSGIVPIIETRTEQIDRLNKKIDLLTKLVPTIQNGADRISYEKDLEEARDELAEITKSAAPANDNGSANLPENSGGLDMAPIKEIELPAEQKVLSEGKPEDKNLDIGKIKEIIPESNLDIVSLDKIANKVLINTAVERNLIPQILKKASDDEIADEVMERGGVLVEYATGRELLGEAVYRLSTMIKGN